MNVNKSEKSTTLYNLDVKNATPKNGGYEIRCYLGTDPRTGKQKRPTQMWYPDETKTVKQNKTELERQVILWAEQCKHQGNIPMKEPLFYDVAQEFFQVKSLEVSDNTIERYRECSQRVYETFGHLRLDDIETRQIQAFAIRLLNSPRSETMPKSQDAPSRKKRKSNTVKSETKAGQPLGRQSVSLHLNFISGVFRYAMENGITDANPCINSAGESAVKLPPRVKGCKKDIYTPDEIEEIFTALKAEATAEGAEWRRILLYYLIFTAAMTGARAGELVSLTWTDIDFKYGTITIDKHAVFVKGKGSMDVSGTKRGVDKLRVISPPENLFEILSEYKQRQDDYAAPLRKAGMWNESGKVFCSETGSSLYVSQPRKWLESFFKRQGNAAENGGYKNPHIWRHINITLRILGGDDLASICYDGGWADLRTMLAEYTHYNAVRKARQSRALDVLAYARNTTV